MGWFSNLWREAYTKPMRMITGTTPPPAIPKVPEAPIAGQPATLASSAVQSAAARMRKKAGGAYAGGLGGPGAAALNDPVKTAGATLLGG
jgi:hypothetical protein